MARAWWNPTSRKFKPFALLCSPARSQVITAGLVEDWGVGNASIAIAEGERTSERSAHPERVARLG